jgi:hypothetical protein
MTPRYAAACVAAVLCVAAIAGAAIVAHRMAGDAESELASHRVNPPVVAPGPSANREIATSKPRPSDANLRERTNINGAIARAEVIVVATVVDSTMTKPERPGDAPEAAIRFRVVRTVKGNLDECRTPHVTTADDGTGAKMVTIQCPAPAKGKATDGMVWCEWFLLLTPEFVAGRSPYSGMLTVDAEPRVHAVLAANGESIATKLGPSDAKLKRAQAGMTSLEEMVDKAQVVVVATFLDAAARTAPKQPGDLSETSMRFRVARVLKGKLDNTIVTVQRPSWPGVDELAGKEWILMLTPEYIAGKHRYGALCTVEEEAKIRAMLAAKPVIPVDNGDSDLEE